MKHTLARPLIAAAIAAASVITPATAPPLTALAQAQPRLAYVYRSDTNTANDWSGLLTGAGYQVTLVALNDVLATNFAQFDAALVADDTGYLDDWGTAANQVAHIANATQVLGIGEGGYAFFGKLGLNIGWPNGAHNSESSVRGDASLSYYLSPNDLSGMLNPPLQVFGNPIPVVEPYLPLPVAGVTVLGRAVTTPPNQNPDHYAPLVAERCHQLWGFRGRPAGMTANGRLLFVNAVSYLLNAQCQGRVPSCELTDARQIPAPDKINFDALPSGTLLTNQYQAQTGATFAQTNVQSDANASSAPNVARGAVVGGGNPTINIAFDSPKTHVGFNMGNGTPTAAIVGTITAFDAAGAVICQASDPVAVPQHSEFIGVYDPQGRIASVRLSYSLGNESLDDLLIAPAKLAKEDFAIPDRPPVNPDDLVNIEIGKNDNTGFSAKFTFPPLQYWTQTVIEGGVVNTYTQVLLPNQEAQTGDPGLPDVPIYRRTIGIPEGAKVKVKGISAAVNAESPVLLLPAQPQAQDQTTPPEPAPEPDDSLFASAPFTKDVAAYASDGFFPAQPVSVVPLGKMRDLHLVQIDVAAGQFNPKNKLFKSFGSVEFELEFEGGAGGFLPGNKIGKPFENHFDGIYSQALNISVLDQFPLPNLAPDPLVICGEYLIITAPTFTPAANKLRNWKVQKGISTFVVETGNGAGKAGTTAQQIHQFIANRYANCVIRPSYLLLFGDSGAIPTYMANVGDESWATDLGYALMANPFYDAGIVGVIPVFHDLGVPIDYLPDLAYGRIPVDTLNEATTIVDKVIAYEKTPPAQTSFYSNMTFASYFQCCRNDVLLDGTDTRSFIETSEYVRTMLQGLYGFNVGRVYNTSRKYHDEADEGLYPAFRSATPNRYRNGSLLPADLRASSGYPWSGGESNIIDAINAGRNLVLHRDHGWEGGWGDPDFDEGSIASLANNNLTPVVYSVNCTSGRFDGGDWWAEKLLRKADGGAVAIIGDTRVSPTWANSALTRGLFDATWPLVVPLYGNPAKSHRRLGDILNYAKLYMLAQVGVPQTAGSVSWASAFKNINIYHVLGDPTLELWTVKPELNLPGIAVGGLTIGQNSIEFNYPVPDAFITALQDGAPVGRTKVASDGAVKVLFDVPPDPNKPIQLSASKDDKVSVSLGQVGKQPVYLPIVVKQ